MAEQSAIFSPWILAERTLALTLAPWQSGHWVICVTCSSSCWYLSSFWLMKVLVIRGTNPSYMAVLCQLGPGCAGFCFLP